MLEVLLSYRLLFGQHSASRRLFRLSEKEKAMVDHDIDSLLCSLCGDGGMKRFESLKPLLRERGVYNVHINFPRLGERLLELADYSASQRPRNLLEVWKDQREPEKLLTFKAVIIFGATAIVLGVLQIIIGILQIVVKVMYPTTPPPTSHPRSNSTNSTDTLSPSSTFPK